MREQTYACPDCRDDKFVFVNQHVVDRAIPQLRAATANTVFPCQRCNGKTYARWTAGEYRSDFVTRMRRADELVAGPAFVKEALVGIRATLGRRRESDG